MNVLVTGSANGIGYAVAKYLSKMGATVFACDIVEKDFNDKNITFIKTNIASEKDVENLYKFLSEKNITLDAIINIAGIFTIDSFIEIDNSSLKKIFDVNLLGAMLINKTLYPLLKKDGRIVVTTSEVAPLDPMPFNGIYNVSKTALDCYCQSLRQELNLLGQKVITIRPGAFNTNLAQGSLTKTKELTEKTVLYKKQSVKFYGLVKMFMGTPLPPEKIAKIYYKAITKKHPKLIYKKHTNILLKLMNILPKRMQCAIIKQMLKTKKSQGEN